jgi:hypothetical protein
MKKKYFILIVIFSVFCLCTFDVLESEKMEDLLYDIHIAETAMNIRKVSSAKETRREYYDYIFEKHHTTRVQFEKSIKYYAANPKKLELIYENVKKRVEKLQSDVENYVYHPEAKELDASKMLDTIPIFKFEKSYNFNSSPTKDLLAFEVADRNYFALSDRFVLRFLMFIEPLGNNLETLPNTQSFLTITYSNGVKKTISAKILSDSKWYRYTFQMPVNDTILPVKIHGNLFFSNDMVKTLKIDSAELVKIYNPEKYPLPDSIKTTLGIDIKPEIDDKLVKKADTVFKKPFEFQQRSFFENRRLEKSQFIKKTD